jgi:hypothetical protein
VANQGLSEMQTVYRPDFLQQTKSVPKKRGITFSSSYQSVNGLLDFNQRKVFRNGSKPFGDAPHDEGTIQWLIQKVHETRHKTGMCEANERPSRIHDKF